MFKKQIFAVCVGLLLFIGAMTPSGCASGTNAATGCTFAKTRPDRAPVPDLAVVPIIINTGAALFPTIMAFLANIAAVVFNPKALGRFLRLRWRLVTAATASLALVAVVGIPLLRSTPVSRTAARAGTVPAGQINWAKVAEDLIAQEKLHQTIAAPEMVAAASVNAMPFDTPAGPPAIQRQDSPPAPSNAGTSPAGLTPLWSFQPEDGLFLGMPAIVGKRIYVSANQTDLGGYTGLLASLDFDTGKPIWQVTEIDKQALPPFFSSPAVTADGKYLVIGQGLHQDRNSSLLCFETATGKLHWAVKTPLHIESSPAIFGDMAVVGAGAIEGNDGKPVGDPGFVFAVRISDGKQLWKQAVNDPESSPAIDSAGIVYIGSGFNGQAVVALRSGSDDELQTQKLNRIVWRTPLAYPITAPVTLSGELVIVGGGNGDMVHSDKNPQGLVVALNRKTGQIVWQAKFEDSVLGRVVVRDKMMIAPLRTGEVAALAVTDGHILWRSRVSGTAPVLVGGALTKERAYVVSSDGYLVAFAASTGKMLEKVYLNDQAQGRHGPVAFVTAGSGQQDNRGQRDRRLASAGGHGWRQMIAASKYTKYTNSLINSRDSALVGGKGASLGKLIRAGFQVPGGFVVNTHAYRLAYTSGKTPEVPPEVAAEIRDRYEEMGGGTVAVRSSATAEDLAAASMAGQCETFLDISGDEALIEAVRNCWASLHTERIHAYLNEHEIDHSTVAMAVVVQRLVPADVAGVLFTADPSGGGRKEMLIDANWGLGETVVGGHVQPDVLRLDAVTGRVLSASIADKTVYISAGTAGEKPVEESRRKRACLNSRDVHGLWLLGRQAEQYFTTPQDIEWAIHDGKLYLLQSRPITTQREIEARQEVMLLTREHLRHEIAAERGPWALHNLAETLPHPTALTWSVIKPFMSGSGGFGAMYRRAGFQPSPAIDRDGFLELISGRVYMDVTRSPEMFCEDFPFAYDLQQLVNDPEASQKPPSVPRGSFSTRVKASGLLAKAMGTIKTLAQNADADFREKTIPEIKAWVARSREQDLPALSTEDLIALWREREHQVLDVFGPQTLLPSLICGMVWADLEAFLHENFWDENADSLLRLIAAGGRPDHTVIANAELFEVADGTRDVETWLAAHGHRGPGEFDLASPRWREQPDRLRDMVARLATGDPPLERFERNSAIAAAQASKLRVELSPAQAREFDRRLDLVHRFMPFREEGKDYLMLSYDVLREAALELGRRLDVGDGVFHLTRDEIFDALRVGFAPHNLIEQRQLGYRAEIKLALPRVIDVAAIERLGEPAEVEMTAGAYKALPLSAGHASGPARVLHEATEAGDFGTGYILVCPSTDPAWTPLFVNAAGLVLECGGALSHGAVVAREMGLPAVVLSDATRIFRNGEHIDIDGNHGRVGRAQQDSSQAETVQIADPSDTRLPRALTPPPSGAKDLRAASWRNVALGIWTVYLLAFFILPKAYVHQPSLAIMDFFFWPLVLVAGKPGAVAVIAAGVAVVTLLVQKLVTDNRALVEAQRRAAALNQQARSLPENSPRRKAMTELAATVNGRLLMARLVPVCLLLGPLMMPFVWFRDRIDPSVPVAAAGSPVQIVASIDGEWTKPVRIEVPSGVELDETTAAARTLPPVRNTLEHLLTLYREPQSRADGPWELQIAPDVARIQTASSLKSYLDAGLPPQGMTWTLRPPANTSRRFPVSVVTEGHSPVALNVVLGNQYPPGTLACAAGGAGSPVKELRIVYPHSSQKPVFWQPMGSVNIGWLGIYLLTYLPVLFVLQKLMKVA